MWVRSIYKKYQGNEPLEDVLRGLGGVGYVSNIENIEYLLDDVSIDTLQEFVDVLNYQTYKA